MTSAQAEEFLYIVTHDLKAFTRAMRTIPDWIEEDIAPLRQKLPDGVLSNFQMLQDYARRMDEMLDALTELSRVGRIADVPVSHDLTTMISQHCETLPKHPAMTYDIACDGIQIFGPENDFNRLFSAVIANVSHHHDKDKGHFSITANVLENRVHVTISDNGPGIEPGQFHAVFKPLCTLRPKSQTGRAGIGLSVAQQVVLSLGGQIGFHQNDRATGCVLRFDLPASEDAYVAKVGTA